MKFATALFVTIAATSAFAGSRYCLDAKQTFNSHPSIACPAATEICVKNLVTTKDKESAKSIILINKNKKTFELPFSSYGQENSDDISSHLIYTFYKDGVMASYEIESDEWYPHPKVTGTFNRLSISTGKKSNDNSVNVSQQCYYEVVK